MSRTTVFFCKFVGTVGLGLLTGLNYTISTTTIPALYLLPTVTPAHSTFRHLRNVTSQQQVLLSTIAASSLLVAYALSPPRGRHPYLLWATLAVGLGFGQEVVDLYWGIKQQEDTGNWAVEDFLSGKGKATDDTEQNLNGEALRDQMETWRASQKIRTGISGFGWAMTVVGIWGDFY